MATYTDTKTFVDTYPEGSADRMFIREAAEVAYEYINSALASCYSVPFSPTPSVIEKISNLLTRAIAISIMTKGAAVTIKDVKDRSPVDPVQWLEDIRGGGRSIPGVARLTTTGAWLSTEDQMHIFDLDHEIYHEVDQDRLDDLVDERQ